LIPVAGKIGVCITIKSAIGLGREMKANILGYFQVSNKVKESLTVRLPWISRVLCLLVHGGRT
jgi:hypothetical protein